MLKFQRIWRVCLFALALFLPTALTAQNVPGLFDVTGVAQNDVLNVRVGPDAGSDKIDALLPNQQSVEVVSLSQNGKWGLVNTNEGSGWVSMRYLQARNSNRTDPLLGWSCSGTEPFWSLSFETDGTAAADWSLMGLTEQNDTRYMSVWSEKAQNRAPPVYGFRLADETTASGVQASGVITTRLCNDGMSDRTYGYSIDVLLSGPENSIVSGCCSLSGG